MLKLEEITKHAALTGIEPGQVVRVVTTEPVGDNALTVYYKTSDGRLLERMLFRTDEASLALAEAYRINLAYLFDPMMAIHTSNVQALPHQITAVYESMLPRQPLRYVLADDPGAGKTIMAGSFIRELLMRADARRVLIVAPVAVSSNNGRRRCSRSLASPSRPSPASRSSSRTAAIPLMILTCWSPVSTSFPGARISRKSCASPSGTWWLST